MKKIISAIFSVLLSVTCNAQAFKIESLSSQNFNNYVTYLNKRIMGVENRMNVLITKNSKYADLSKSSVQKSYIKEITDLFMPVSNVRIYWRSAKNINKNGACSSMKLEDFLKNVSKDKIVVLSIDSIGLPIWNEELTKRKDKETKNCYASYWAQSKMAPFRVQKRPEFTFKKGDVNDVRKHNGNSDLLIARKPVDNAWRWVPLFGTLVVHCQ